MWEMLGAAAAAAAATRPAACGVLRHAAAGGGRRRRPSENSDFPVHFASNVSLSLSLSLSLSHLPDLRRRKRGGEERNQTLREGGGRRWKALEKRQKKLCGFEKMGICLAQKQQWLQTRRKAVSKYLGPFLEGGWSLIKGERESHF